jgi:hypothetical protein
MAAVTVVALCVIVRGRSGEVPNPPMTRNHAVRTLVFQVAGPARAALALFDPIQESRWSPDWHPTFSDPARATEAGSVFTTHAGAGTAIWLLDTYDRAAGQIRYVEVQPGRTLTRIAIVASPAGPERATVAVTYDRTSLSPQGDVDVLAFARHFASQRTHWELALNDAVRRSR